MTARLAVVTASLSLVALSLCGVVYHQRVVTELEREAGDIRAEYDAFRYALIRQTAETLQRNAGAVDTALTIREERYAEIHAAGAATQRAIGNMGKGKGKGKAGLPVSGAAGAVSVAVRDELVRLWQAANTVCAGDSGSDASPRPVCPKAPAAAPGTYDLPGPCRMDDGAACHLR